MILHLYFGRMFLMIFFGISMGFAVFLWLVELLEHIRRFDTSTTRFVDLAYLSLLHVPEVLYQIVTLIVLLSAVSLFINLARSSELVVSRATGRSALLSLLAPVIVSALLGAVLVAAGNPFVAALSRHYETEFKRLRGEDSVVSITDQGLWLRQGGDDQQTAIHALSANLDGTRLFDVTFHGFDGSGTPVYRVDAAEAGLTDGAWVLTDAKRWRFTDVSNPEAQAELLGTMLIPSDLTREQIRDNFGTPSSIPIWDLPGFIGQLETAGFSARAHRIWFQSELARPLGFVAMVMIGAVFTLRHTRMGRTGLMVLLSVLSGFTVYFAGNLTKVMGESGQLPVSLAVWSPPLAAICLALALLLHLEDG